MKDQIINHLKETQRKLQSQEIRGYTEAHANNDLVEFYNEYLSKNYDKELKGLKDDFYHLTSIFLSIASYSKQGHWKSVMSTQIGWMLSRWS